jgi:putative membrane protein
MIVIPKNTTWLRILFSWRGTALRRVWLRVLAVTLIATAVEVYHHISPIPEQYSLTVQPFSLIGLALGIFLGFRNNTSYDRFWEGRRLWGSLVNTSRTLTRQILTLVGPIPEPQASRLTEPRRWLYRVDSTEPHDEASGEMPAVDTDDEELVAFHKEMVHRLAAYVHCFRMHLRDQDALHELRRLLPEDEVEALKVEPNRPIAILQTLGDRFRDAWLRGWIHPLHMSVLDKSLTDLCDIQGGCERVKSTPIPFSYTALIHSIVAIYCVALPFGLIEVVGFLTPVVVAIVAYAFFGLDAVGDEIEDPFGTEENDLPLAAISTMIEINVRHRIGDRRLPAMPKPVNRVLS